MKTTLWIFLMIAGGLQASIGDNNDPNVFMNQSKPKDLDKESFRRELTETMESVESLAVQMKDASKAELGEIRRSGKEDFKLSGGNIDDVLESADDLLKALALESGSKADAASAKKFREKARSAMRSMHRYAKEEFLRNLRNWILVSEGSLRHDHAATPSPSPQP